MSFATFDNKQKNTLQSLLFRNVYSQSNPKGVIYKLRRKWLMRSRYIFDSDESATVDSMFRHCLHTVQTQPKAAHKNRKIENWTETRLIAGKERGESRNINSKKRIGLVSSGEMRIFAKIFKTSKVCLTNWTSTELFVVSIALDLGSSVVQHQSVLVVTFG